MRTTLDIDDDLLARAHEYAPGLTKTALLEEGLRALIKIESARRLAGMVGTQPPLEAPPRRKVS